MYNPNIRAQLLRGLLTSTDDSGSQQLMALTGLDGQSFGETVRSQHFGLTSVPPADAEALMLVIGGGNDRVHALGVEHPKYRPTNLPEGASRQYDKDGNYCDIRGDTMTLNHAKKIVLQVGSCTLTIDSDGFHFAGGKIDHDGHKVDKTHVHTNAGGSGNSGPPP